MRLFSESQHRAVLQKDDCNVTAAGSYNKLLAEQGVDHLYRVTRQNVKYWRMIFGEDRTNMAAADRVLKEERILQPPAPVKGDTRYNPEREYRQILVIPDQHAPYQHPDALEFLSSVAEQYDPDLVVNLGDELDYHAMSFHDSDPNLDSAGVELERGKVWLAALAELFPEQLVCDSNHGSMSFRKAKAHGLPVQLIKSYYDVIFPEGGPDWQWAESWRVRTPNGDVLFKHQSSGPVVNDAAHNQCNLMVGHNHGNFSIEYAASSAWLYWGCYSGCLVDKDSLAFAYGKHSLKKPILGCTVITNGIPVLVPMLLDSAGRWSGRTI